MPLLCVAHLYRTAGGDTVFKRRLEMAALAGCDFPYGTDYLQDLTTTAMDLLYLKRSCFETTLQSTS